MSIIHFDNTKSSSAHELVEQISQCVPSHVQIDILKQTYPNGVVRNNTFYIGSLSGERGESLKIDINPSSPNFMRGHDFNEGSGIGGIVKILMKGRGMRLPEIKEMFGSYLPAENVRAPDWARPGAGLNLNNVPVSNGVQQDAPTPPAEPVQEKVRINANTPHSGEWDYISRDGEILVTVRRYDIDGKKEFRPWGALKII